jgi:nicotinate phosphoribosyltransferase
MPNYDLKVEDGQFVTEFEGPWAKSIYWETLDLSIKNELYYRELTRGLDKNQMAVVYAEGNRRLEEKFDMFRQNPFATFLEFGTRRRWSGAWQDNCVKRAKEEIPNQIIGTSNVKLAMKYGMKPKGTMAHELFMIMSGIMHGSDDEIRASHQHVLREWWDEYGKDLSVALTDTYGSNFFFKDMPQDLAEAYNGMRQDSGNPRKFADKEIGFYQERGIDPTKKLFIPSDGLTARKIVDLQAEYRGRIMQTAGWGTTFTNDFGYGNLSVVVKAVEANGYGTVKLSDNPAKSIGKPEDIARFRKIFDYNVAEYETEECLC